MITHGIKKDITEASRPGATDGQGRSRSGQEEPQERSQPPPGPLTGLSEWSGPTRFKLVIPGASGVDGIGVATTLQRESLVTLITFVWLITCV